jgi:hypothetical protein
MKKYIIMAIIAMAVAVQGYAQPRPRYYHRPHYHYHYYPRVMPSYYYWSAVYGYYYYPLLGCYWWGSAWDQPTKIKIDCLELKHTASGRLRIKNGDQPKQYLSMWQENALRFRCPSGVVVDVTTGNGETKVKVYGKDGKTTASYTL